jgi:hypothetical protein
MGWFKSSHNALPEELERLLYPNRHLAKALEQHASGLRLSLYGLLLMVGGMLGLLILLLGPLLNIEPNAIGWILGLSVTLAVTGSFVNIWGKYRCFEFPIPLSGRWLLSVAIWCDGIMLTTRFVSRMIPMLKVFRLAEPVLLVVGLVFFLLFLRSLADVIHRADLKRSAIYVLVGLGMSILTIPLFVVGAAFRAKAPGLAFPLLGILFLSLGSIVLTMGLYARLLWQMSHGLADFAKYLRTAEDHLGAEGEGEEAEEDHSGQGLKP